MPRQVSGKKRDTYSIRFNFGDIIAGEVELVVTSRYGLAFDDIYFVVDKNEILRISVDALSVKLSKLTVLYFHCV